MTRLHPRRIHIAVVVLYLFTALLLRSWLSGSMVQSGTDPVIAADLSYLAVPVCIAILLWPLLCARPGLVRNLFRHTGLGLSTCLYAVLLGVLMRIAYWAQLVTFVALGIYRDLDAETVSPAVFSFACPALPALLLGFFTMCVLTPLVEEFMHRGLIQSALCDRGPLLAVTVSALIFMVFHRTSAWHFALFAGLVLGTVFWKSRTLWLPVITHATINGLAQLDWRCLRGQWHPPADTLPLWSVAGTSLLLMALAFAGVLWILCKKMPGSNVLPGSEQLTERVRPAR
jgi:membrane protease YdiL (CAAX protease family)